MGMERGTVIIFERKFWLFERYSSNRDMKQTFILHGMNGEIIEALADKCFEVLSPNEIDFEALEKGEPII